MRTLLILLLSITLASCGTLTKSVQKQKSDTTSSVVTEDKSITKITEKADTTVKVKGDTAKASTPLENITRGDTLKAESNGTKVEVFFNPSTGRIHAKAITEPREIPIVVDRTTEIHTDTKQVTETQSHKETVDKHVDRQESNLLSPWLWGIWLIALLVLLYVLWRLAPKFL